MSLPNYEEYSMSDLQDALSNMDRDKYADRYKLIATEIQLRKNGKMKLTKGQNYSDSSNKPLFQRIIGLVDPHIDTFDDINRIIKNSSIYLFILFGFELLRAIYLGLTTSASDNAFAYFVALSVNIIEILLVYCLFKKKRTFILLLGAIILFYTLLPLIKFTSYSVNIFYLLALYFISISNNAILKEHKLLIAQI